MNKPRVYKSVNGVWCVYYRGSVSIHSAWRDAITWCLRGYHMYYS